MSRALDNLSAARSAIHQDREGDRKWLLSTLLGSIAGLDLRKLHRKLVAGGKGWSLDYVRRLCEELAENNRAHKDGDRWRAGPGATPYVAPSQAPKLSPPRAQPLPDAQRIEPLPPRTGLPARADRRLQGSDHPRARLTEETVRQDRQRAAQGESVGELARERGVALATMQFAVRGDTWRHVEGSSLPNGTAEDLAPCSSAAAEVVTGQGLETALSPSGSVAPAHTPVEAGSGTEDGQPAPSREAVATEEPGCLSAPDAPPSEQAVGDNDPVALFPSQTAPLAPEVESVRWESPPGVPEEPSSRLSPSAEPSHGGGADGSRAAVSAGEVGQPAGASAGVGALVGAGPSRPGPSGDRQLEHGADPAPPVSPSCPPSPVPVSVVVERAPALVPGVGAEPERDGFGWPLRRLVVQLQVGSQLIGDALQQAQGLEALVAQAEELRAQAEAHQRQALELEGRVAELEAENARLRGKVEHVLSFLGAP